MAYTAIKYGFKANTSFYFSHRIPIAKVFLTKMRCNVVMLSYRGYGKSEGSPSEKGIKLDAQASLDFILSHPILEKTKVFLYGQSIGMSDFVLQEQQTADVTYYI